MTQTIDATGLPEPVVENLRKLIDSLKVRPEVGPRPGPQKEVRLPLWDGRVIGAMTRRELYDDVG